MKGLSTMRDLREKLKGYVEKFNAQDEECFVQAVDNAHAYDWLAAQIPLLECPDQALEETYYFRWWTFRKHMKETPAGHIVTEFLPSVFWAGAYNSINCACCHHVLEGRWLSDEAGWMKEYIRFWLSRTGNSLSYSSWLASVVEDYCALRGDDAFEAECLPGLVSLYESWEEKSLQPCGLFWSDDDRDGMEYSVSGPGLRPTINAYMYGDAMAIARMAKRCGREELAKTYEEKAKRLREKIDAFLWDGDFYRTIPCEKGKIEQLSERPDVHPDHRVRELVGYLPWYFDMPDAGKEKAFAQLMDPDGFYAMWGLTTAEQRHPRFMFTHEHECLWNGPVWPFATAQTLTAAARMLRKHGAAEGFGWEEYRTLLRQYALSHRIQKDDGTWQMWIDEDMHPYTGDWIARTELRADGWKKERGGYERGKDYNHSTFCDLVLSGLLGIGTDKEGRLTAQPMVPQSWTYFKVSGVWHRGARYTIIYDRDGSRYGCGAGVSILPEEEKA
ncbi:MAG: hypothetical protein IJD60_04345 [Clostridia bacterium]|nr:hypothetical protein [Clostridia bacterium]